MARPKKYADAAERLRAWRKGETKPVEIETKPANVSTDETKPRHEVQGTKWYPDDGRFAGVGRCRPVGGMVLVSFGENDDRMVSEGDWVARQGLWCEHGWAGWSCKACIEKALTLRSRPPSRSVEALAAKLHGSLVETGEVFVLGDGREAAVLRRVKAGSAG